MNAAAFLTKQVLHNGDRAAVIHGDRTYSYATFGERCLALAGGLLGRGLQRGDRVALMLPNGPEVLEVIYGCFAAGLVVVPVNYRLHPSEVAYILENSGARLLVTTEEFLASAPPFQGIDVLRADAADYEDVIRTATALAQPRDVDPDEPVWLFYTSGTTGRPKGAIWTHRIVRVVVMNYLADLYNYDERDVVLHAAPLTHGSGIVALPAIARGATNVVLDTRQFEPSAVFRLIERHGVTAIAFLAPTQIVKLLEEYRPGGYDLSTLQAITYGGAPIYIEHLQRAIDAFGPVFVQLYGQGEAPITATGLTRREHAEFHSTADPRLGSAGRCRTDVEIRVVDADDKDVRLGLPGEILVRGDVVMPGYWGAPEATAETLRDGWLHTGDIGSLDERGYLYILDRAKDVVITGGNNVYPREVEEVLLTHAGVANAVVLGIPDAYWGEAVHAVVQLEPGADVSQDELIELCRSQLASYKKPKSIDFVDALPQNAYGKILRRELRDRYWEGHDRRIGWSEAGAKV
jgi:acyl-CoA synthetase (AMP-forming)/AMP-acid ligase II